MFDGEGTPVVAPSGNELALVHVGACTGTLLNKNWILTARRCVTDARGNLLESVRVTTPRLPESIRVDTAALRVHPDLAVDVALLALDTPLDLGQPDIELFWGHAREALGLSIAVYGYGFLNGVDEAAQTCSVARQNACKSHQTCDGFSGICRTPGLDLRHGSILLDGLSADGEYRSVVANGKYVHAVSAGPPLMGDIGGASFLRGQLVAVSTGSEFLAYATSFRAWIRGQLRGGSQVFEPEKLTLESGAKSLGTPLTGDFNGDGRADVAWIADTKGVRRGSVFVALTRADGTLGEPSSWHSSFILSDERPGVGDFDGDGRADLVAFGADAHASVTLSDGAGFGIVERWNGLMSYSDEEPGVGDFNGDGRDDVTTFVRYQSWGHVWVTLSCAGAVSARGCVTTRSFSERHFWEAPFIGEFDDPRVGDVNGDGVADLITLTPNGDLFVSLTSKRLCVSNADCAEGVCWSRFGVCPDSEGTELLREDGWPATRKTLWLGGLPPAPKIFYLADVNGDGLDDALIFGNDGGGLSGPQVAFSTGAYFQRQVDLGSEPFEDGAAPRVGDMDGDGRADVLSVISDESGTRVRVRLAR